MTFSRAKLWAIALLLSASNGLSSAGTMGYAWYLKSGDAEESISVCTVFSVCIALRSLCFQGQSVLKYGTEDTDNSDSDDEDNEDAYDDPDEVFYEAHSLDENNDKNEVDEDPNEKFVDCNEEPGSLGELITEATSSPPETAKPPPNLSPIPGSQTDGTAEKPFPSHQDEKSLPKNSPAKPSTCERIKTAASATLQIINTAIHAIDAGVDRIFLLHYILTAFSIPISWPAFGACLGLELAFFKLPFDGTNEIWESNQLINKWVTGKKSVPFYANNGFFKSMISPEVGRMLARIGSFDHASVDDATPWVPYMIDAINFLGKDPKIIYTLAAIAGVIGIGMTALIYFQTFYYEGTHTQENLAKFKKYIYENPKLSPRCAAFLSACSKYLMAPLHGAATSSSIYVMANQIGLGTPYALLSALLTGAANSIGVYYADVKEALGNIKKQTNPPLAETIFNPPPCPSVAIDIPSNPRPT